MFLKMSSFLVMVIKLRSDFCYNIRLTQNITLVKYLLIGLGKKIYISWF